MTSIMLKTPVLVSACPVDRPRVLNLLPELSQIPMDQYILPFQKRYILLKTFIESQFSYCPLIWMFCSGTMNKKINHIHERALRIVYRDYESSFDSLLNKDRSLTFHHRNIHQVAIEMFKIKHDLSPPFMKDIFYTINGEICRPNINSVKKGCRSLRNFGPIVWNSLLPDKHKSCKTLDEFKISIRDWKPENCPCELCHPIIPGVGRIKSGMSKNSDYYYYWFLIWFVVVVVYSLPVLYYFTMNFIDFLLGVINKEFYLNLGW